MAPSADELERSGLWQVLGGTLLVSAAWPWRWTGRPAPRVPPGSGNPRRPRWGRRLRGSVVPHPAGQPGRLRHRGVRRASSVRVRSDLATAAGGGRRAGHAGRRALGLSDRGGDRRAATAGDRPAARARAGRCRTRHRPLCLVVPGHRAWRGPVRRAGRLPAVRGGYWRPRPPYPGAGTSRHPPRRPGRGTMRRSARRS